MVQALGLKPQELYDMHVHEFLYWCMYFKAKNEEIERQTNLVRMKNR